MYFLLLLTLASCAQARPGLLFAPALHAGGIEYVHAPDPVHPHPAVQFNAESEALLPPELVKSKRFYDNPAIAAGLAQESWFTNKEMQVLHRQAEDIPRERIYDIVKSAGFLDRH